MYFYPRSPCGERLTRSTRHETDRQFLSTLSLRRATLNRMPTVQYLWNFYPRSPCGERLAQAKELGIVFRISIHALLAESDLSPPLWYYPPLHFYPRSPCGERLLLFSFPCVALFISIHALLAESDAFYNRFKPCARYFYPRSPCGERRSDIFPVLRFSLFLSTLSLRRATVSLQRWAAHLCDFYPRSPCGERLKLPPPPPLLLPISIHALLAESDVRQGMATLSQPIFLSTLSLRRATVFVCVICQRLAISIHALLAESDAAYVAKTGMTEISIHALLAESDRPAKPDRSAPDNFYPRSPCGERPCWRWDNPNTKPNFYPRSPCGERLMPSCKAISLSRFLSTLSLRRATLTYKSGYASDSISIHALLAESDYRPGPFQLSRTEFLSTLSLRRATRSAPEQLRTVRVFLSTLSLRRATK